MACDRLTATGIDYTQSDECLVGLVGLLGCWVVGTNAPSAFNTLYREGGINSFMEGYFNLLFLFALSLFIAFINFMIELKWTMDIGILFESH